MDDNANWLSESKKRLFDWDLQRTEKKRGHVAQFSIHHQLEDIKGLPFIFYFSTIISVN